MTKSQQDGSQSSLSDQEIERKKRHYQTLTTLWSFPSMGALLILALNIRAGLSSDIFISPRIEDLAALAVLLCHLGFGIQHRRFHQLLQIRKRTTLTSTDT